jgi:hypothetical protein
VLGEGSWLGYFLECSRNLLGFLARQRTGALECARPGNRSFNILGEELMIEREGIVEYTKKLRRLAFESPAP